MSDAAPDNYQKYFMTKPKDYHSIRELSEEYDIPKVQLQIIAKTLKIKKDAANIYYFDKEDMEKFERFLQITEYKKKH